MTLLTTPFSADATASDVLDGVDLTGRRAIVTGGASGIGAEAVRALARAGAHVTIAARNPAAARPLLDELPGVDVRAIDLSDLGSVRAFVAGWDGPLDILVANAGIMAVPTRQLTAEGWELQLATNYLGHFALITGLHDDLKAAGRARVVVVSSGVQQRAPFDFDDPQFDSRPYNPWTAYAQSKVAGVLLAVGISRRWAGDGITANAVMPGWIHTNLQRHVDDATMRAMGAMDEHGNLLTPDFYKTPEQGAATSVLLAASPLVEGVSGGYFEDNQQAPVVEAGEDRTGVAAWSVDPDAAERLWDYATAALIRAGDGLRAGR
ncbi:oxidoreductase [Actinoplanes cyaneus]|uniref:Probable oxidoreductase n=1 Tax=Actinoplanes cyaneus TaxID=52696 RepID=A0A919INY4_9ACTN|nr:SDR family NAD(P)-dependent oxidoreductase [Actinoplanes cyaneus]MCW2141717.1 NAD(P)-dependent dehydrogenase, short-chain alcohol dehydrogenase family [Actinoplanes cyaneus]GID68201.1 oxidoreductase [Actinoplanes cyaneus]